MTWPRFHHADRLVSNHWLSWGMNSRKMMLSTGTFPPAAVPTQAHRAQKVTKFCEPATAHANMPPIRMVALKAGLRPIRSAVTPQNDAPMISPT